MSRGAGVGCAQPENRGRWAQASLRQVSLMTGGGDSGGGSGDSTVPMSPLASEVSQGEAREVSQGEAAGLALGGATC